MRFFIDNHTPHMFWAHMPGLTFDEKPAKHYTFIVSRKDYAVDGVWEASVSSFSFDGLRGCAESGTMFEVKGPKPPFGLSVQDLLALVHVAS